MTGTLLLFSDPNGESPVNIFLVVTNDDNTTYMWHCRLGHIGVKRMKKLHTDNPQEQGIIVAPLNVEVRYRSAGARRKSYLFHITKVSQVLVDYALNRFKEQGG